MLETKQTDTLSVFEHGVSVWEYTQKILSQNWEGMRIPTWLSENFQEILQMVHPLPIIKRYNVFHDCGKPFCLTVVDGKRHFPNHAEISKSVYLETWGDKIVANLIGWDMVFHTETAEQIKERNLSKQDSLTLLVTAVAELHSNAEMFGGIESESFKIKWKKIDKRGRALFR